MTQTVDMIAAMLATHGPDATVSVRQAAEYFGKHPETIRRWLRASWLPGRKAVPGSRAWRIAVKDLSITPPKEATT